MALPSIVCAQARSDQVGEDSETKRQFRQEDSIEMTRIAGRDAINEYAGALTKDFAYFSPDRQKFVVVLRRGNLERNTNDYSLLLFETREVFHSPQSKVLVAMSSSSNREGITNPVWLADGKTILFLGEHPGETTQVYSVDVTTGTTQRLTNELTNVAAFTADHSGRTVAFMVEEPPLPVVTADSQRRGVTVKQDDMTELLAGSRRNRQLQCKVLNVPGKATKELALVSDRDGVLWGDVRNFAISPGGRYLVVKTNLTSVAPGWRSYLEPLIARLLDRQISVQSLSWIYRYELIELATGAIKVLLDAPVGYRGSEVLWVDATHVVLSGVFLPLDDAQARTLHEPSVVEVDAATFHYRVLSSEDLRMVSWDADTGTIETETRPTKASGKEPKAGGLKRVNGEWERVDKVEAKGHSISVLAEQSLNMPPRIEALDLNTGQRALLLDLNPQFSKIQMGRVEEVRFKGAEEVDVRAGLYFPPDFDSKKKYPLVVQTHGFDRNTFWIDGSFTTAFAAQALASHGMLVLQVPDRHDWDGTAKEAPRMAETLERAIEAVEGMGILDRERIGLIGFSRTGLYIYYLLTHSRFRYRSAVVADGSDGSYSQYMQFLGGYPSVAGDSEAINGGVPFGTGMMYWLRDSIEFRLDLVDTPLLIQAASRESLSSQWAEFTGLKRLGKPVELLYFPNGTHVLEKPWDRLASQQEAVDWSAFWLKDEADSRPEKRERSARWQAMKDARTSKAHQSPTSSRLH